MYFFLQANICTKCVKIPEAQKLIDNFYFQMICSSCGLKLLSSLLIL